MKQRNRFGLFLALKLMIGLAWLTTSGCQSYRLGHPAELPFQTIYVKAVSNDSFAPQAQAIVGTNIRERIIRDGRLRLIGNPDDADAVLEVALSDYNRRPATRDADDTEVVIDYDLALIASVSLYDQVNDEAYFEDRVIEERTIVFVRDLFTSAGEADTQSLVQAEYNAMPRLSRDLAQKIADEVLSAW